MEEKAKPSHVLEANLHDRSAGDVLSAMRGQGHHVDEFTVTPMTDGGKKLTVVLPRRLQREHEFPCYQSPEDILAGGEGIDAVRGIEVSARQHMRLTLNCQHDQAAFLKYVVTQLGGSMKVEEGKAKLRLTADLSSIQRILEFLHAMPELGSNVRVNPVYESLASRPEVDDLAKSTKGQGRHEGGEEFMLRIIGDSQIGPQLDVIQQLENEGNVNVVQLSCHQRPPRSDSFEMVAVLRLRDPSKLAALQGAIVSGHAGVYGADLVTQDKARETVQVVTNAEGARDLANASGGALQAHYKRWADPRLVVSGSLQPRSTRRIMTDVAEAHVPHAVAVPIAIVTPPAKRLRKIRHGFGAFSGIPEEAQEDRPDIREGMRRYLLGLLEQRQ
ncbi:MAG: hypothetical protein PHE68_02440 [Candidatus Peribacteraceae bacterium]|nr:hypothetical protein [Candidatus Peribacteraceae bacterium]MDD5074295.1 hypothetical protein [Candidatus Peribacteraceae bacterium]